MKTNLQIYREHYGDLDFPELTAQQILELMDLAVSNATRKPVGKYYSTLADLWFQGYEAVKGTKPSFGAAEGKALKSISDKIRGKCQELGLESNEENVVSLFGQFCKVALADKWYADNFDLKIINSKFDIIYAKGVTKAESAEQRAERIFNR